MLAANSKKQIGFTLIEVLIAIVVFSLALLSLAALQTMGVRFTRDSYLLTVATQQAEDMIERMRANPQEMNTIGGYYDNLSGSYGGTAVDCLASACDQVQRAQYDHDVWNDRNNNLFGQTGTVTRNGQVFNITLSWAELNKQGSSVPKNYTLIFRP